MRKWLPVVHSVAIGNVVRLIWILLVVVTLVLGSGAPVAFGGGSGG